MLNRGGKFHFKKGCFGNFFRMHLKRPFGYKVCYNKLNRVGKVIEMRKRFEKGITCYIFYFIIIRAIGL